MGKQLFSSNFFFFFTKIYSGKKSEGETVRVCVCVFCRDRKRNRRKEITSLMREKQKVPSSDLGLVKSISVTPGSQT